jgi:hypothetical protein
METTVQGIPDVVLHNKITENPVKGETSFTPFAIGINAAEMGNDSSRGIGFRRPEEPDVYPLDTPQHSEFRIQENEPLALYLIIPNGNEGPRSLLVTAILDYQQVRFEMDGKEGLLHAVTVPTNSHTNIPFKLKVKGAGAHDIQIICFDNPFNQTLDLDYRMNLRGYVSARRAVVIVDGNETPVRSLQPNVAGEPRPSEVTFAHTVYFATAANSTGIHPSKRQIYVDQGQAGQPYPFQIVLNNVEKQAATFAMIPFLDYHQITINGQNALVWQAQSNEEAIIDTKIDLPPKVGVHQLQLVYLYDPYKSVLRKEVKSSPVFGSPRLAIDAR